MSFRGLKYFEILINTENLSAQSLPCKRLLTKHSKIEEYCSPTRSLSMRKGSETLILLKSYYIDSWSLCFP